jgi:hypothetical protein
LDDLGAVSRFSGIGNGHRLAAGRRHDRDLGSVLLFTWEGSKVVVRGQLLVQIGRTGVCRLVLVELREAYISIFCRIAGRGKIWGSLPQEVKVRIMLQYNTIMQLTNLFQGVLLLHF